MKIISTSGNISIYDQLSTVSIAVAEACQIEFDTWWISRVNVPVKFRNQGIGSILLKELINQIKQKPEAQKQKPEAQRIIVEPGGYSNRLEDQIKFYIKNGFVLNSKDKVYQLNIRNV